MDKEIWKDIAGYEGLYQVSNFGNVKNIKTQKNISPFGKNYLVVALYKAHKKKYKNIHRLVATAFLENKNNLPQVNHINGNKRDNRSINLEWCSAKYNIQEAFRLGLAKNLSGEKSVRSKKVNQYDINGNFIKTWESMNIAKETLNIGHIHECCKGRRKTAGGFKWEYYRANQIMEGQI